VVEGAQIRRRKLAAEEPDRSAGVTDRPTHQSLPPPAAVPTIAQALRGPGAVGERNVRHSFLTGSYRYDKVSWIRAGDRLTKRSA